MVSKKKLYIFGEEKPNSSGVYNSISYVLEKLNVPHESSLERFSADLCKGSSRKYEINGFCSYEFASIEYRMVSGNTSMVDLMFYLQEEVPTNQSKPVYFVEITKNAWNQSGNMSDQRAGKSILPLAIYGSVPFLYLVNMGIGARAQPNRSHARALKRMNLIGADVAISFDGEEGVYPVNVTTVSIDSVEDMVEEDAVGRKGPRRVYFDTVHVPNNPRFRYFHDGLVFDCRLDKAGDPEQTSDPNVGFVMSSVFAAINLGWDGIIIIKNHGKLPKYFYGKNKLMHCLRIAAKSAHIYFENSEYGRPYLDKVEHAPFTGTYFRDEQRGEKNGTIALESFLSKRGWKTIFDNHAGCEKSDLVLSTGDRIQIPKKVDNMPLGLPDLIMINERQKRIIVIEGEMSENLHKQGKGYSQVLERKFVRTVDWIRDHFYPQYKFEVHLATYGQHHGEDILYHLNSDGTHTLLESATPVYSYQDAA